MIQISRVTYDENYVYSIYLFGENYQSQHSGFQLTGDSKLIANLSEGETSYVDKVQGEPMYTNHML